MLTADSPTWQLSSLPTDDHGYVDVTRTADGVLVRDSKDYGTGPVLRFDLGEWSVFIAAAVAGAPIPTVTSADAVTRHRGTPAATRWHVSSMRSAVRCTSPTSSGRPSWPPPGMGSSTSPGPPHSRRCEARAALTGADVTAGRLRSQLLAGERPTDGLTAVRRLSAVQAQLPSAARLSVRARTSTTTATDLDRACASGRLLRTWLMRGTLHLAAAEDVRWMLGLLGPVFAAKGRRRREQLGLDQATCERGLAAISEVLRGSPPLNRATLIERVIHRGVAVDPGTQGRRTSWATPRCAA